MRETNTETERRARGTGRLILRGTTWWAQYYNHGVQVRVSTKQTDQKKAERFLHKKIGEVEAGVAPPVGGARVTYENMKASLLADYQANGRKWLRQGKDGDPYIPGLSHLNDYFAGWRAREISTDSVRSFIRKRQQGKAANGTINREIALLHRMLSLAVEDEKVRPGDIPHFPSLKESAPRQGFLEHDEYQKLRQELPEYLRPVFALAYWTGMRKAEILGLRWSNVDLLAAEIRLSADKTKNKQPRTVPLAAEPLELIKMERERHPDGEYVFTRDGEPIDSFVKAWASAVKRAALRGLLFHDLRRTGVRNLVRSGVPETVAMKISGHRNRNVFDRYDITSGKDLKDAASKLETYLATQKIGDKTGTNASSGKEHEEPKSKEVPTI